MRYLMFIITLLLSSSIYANDVNIICSGEGNTKNEAILNALREAVSEANGSFISSKSKLNNNDLIDETVMLTNGEIKHYKEISYIYDNIYTVVLDVTVSLDKMLSYINNHGNTAYINGQALVSNYTLENINKSNIESVLNHILTKLDAVGGKMYDFNISLSKPYIKQNKGYITVEVDCIPNKQFYIFQELYKSSMYKIIKYIDISDNYTSHLIKNYYRCISDMYRIYCYNFDITDNLNHNIEYKLEKFNGCFTKFHGICERLSSGLSVCYNSNISIIGKPTLIYNEYTHIGKVSLQIMYDIGLLNKLTNINVIPA